MSKSILEVDKRCFFCDSVINLEEHHVFGGPNRKLSEHYGLKVHLCPLCHRDNKKGVHGNAEKNMILKMYAQRIFEERYSREEFISKFGKNYLEVDDEDNSEDIHNPEGVQGSDDSRGFWKIL